MRLLAILAICTTMGLAGTSALAQKTSRRVAGHRQAHGRGEAVHPPVTLTAVRFGRTIAAGHEAAAHDLRHQVMALGGNQAEPTITHVETTPHTQKYKAPPLGNPSSESGWLVKLDAVVSLPQKSR